MSWQRGAGEKAALGFSGMDPVGTLLTVVP